jgi:hypothetical protein
VTSISTAATPKEKEVDSQDDEPQLEVDKENVSPQRTSNAVLTVK